MNVKKVMIIINLSRNMVIALMRRKSPPSEHDLEKTVWVKEDLDREII